MGRGRVASLGAALLFSTGAGFARADDAGAPAPTSTPAAAAPSGTNATAAPTSASTTASGDQAAPSAEWGGLYDGRTLGSGGGAFIAEAGWPGFTAGALFALANRFDLGLKVSGLWAGPTVYETNNFQSYFGLDARAVARIGVVDAERVSFLVRLEPGVRFLAFDPQVAWAVEVIAAADVGIHVVKGGTVYLGVEVPLTFVTNPASFTVIPILPGAGFEYHVSDSIGIGGRFMGGPSIDITSTGGVTTTRTDFAFIGQAFFIWRWDRK